MIHVSVLFSGKPRLEEAPVSYFSVLMSDFEAMIKPGR